MHSHQSREERRARPAAGRRGLAVLACGAGSLAAGPAAQAAPSNHGGTVPASGSVADAYLNGVSADSATDAWAVGFYYDGTGTTEQPLILHWDGTGWAQVASPIPSGGSEIQLQGVSAVSGTDAWAAGFYTPSGNAIRNTFALQWNGSNWTQATTPSP